MDAAVLAIWVLRLIFLAMLYAFLWLVAFFFIELNVIEWRHEAAEDEHAVVTSA